MKISNSKLSGYKESQEIKITNSVALGLERKAEPITAVAEEVVMQDTGESGSETVKTRPETWEPG